MPNLRLLKCLKGYNVINYGLMNKIKVSLGTKIEEIHGSRPESCYLNDIISRELDQFPNFKTVHYEESVTKVQ